MTEPNDLYARGYLAGRADERRAAEERERVLRAGLERIAASGHEHGVTYVPDGDDAIDVRRFAR